MQKKEQVMNKRYPRIIIGENLKPLKVPVQNSVENECEYFDYMVDRQSDKTPIVEPPKQGGIPADTREKCTRQVFASKSVAESTVAELRKKGVFTMGLIERCKICGMLHVKELR